MPHATATSISASAVDCHVAIVDRLNTVDVVLEFERFSMTVSMTRDEARKVIDGLIRAMHDAGPVLGSTR